MKANRLRFGRSITCGVLLASASGIAFAAPVRAQDAVPTTDLPSAPEAPAAPAAALSDDGDIVVTAQRREQSLQDVPVAVSAVNERYLEQRNITSVAQLGSIAPNVKIERAATSGSNAQVTIRGATTINGALTWEPTVGMYLDGVYLGKAQGGFFDVADIARVEVLRGPQGTLYGRNTLAGAINIITKKPTGEFGGKAQISYGNFDYKQARATLDLPEFADISVKLSGQITKRDGFYDLVPNPLADVPLAGVSPDKRVDSLDSKSGMVQVRYRPGNRLLFDYAFDYSKIDQNPAYSQPYAFYPGGFFDPASPAYAFVGANLPFNRYVNRERQDEGSLDGDIYEKSRVYGHSLTAVLDVGKLGELKSITAYRDVTFKDQQDLDGTPLPLALTTRDSHYWAFSQELQLAGKQAGFDYLFGLFYSRDKASTLNPQTFFAGGSVFDSRYSGTTRSFAAFGQVDYHVSDRITLTGGLRYTEERKTISRLYIDFANPANNFAYNIDNVPGADPAAGLLAPGRIFTTPRAKYSNLTPTAVLAYKPVEEVNLYAKFARGFKSGGFNGETTMPVELDNPYRPEKVSSYEVGLKSRLFDKRLTLNIAGFWNESRDLQLSVFTGQGAVSSIVQNAGSARIRGIEVEATARASDALTISGSFAYLDPKYKEFIEGGVDVADNRAFSHAAHYQANGSVDWQVIALGNGARLNLIGDINYLSRYFIYPYALRGTSPGGQNAYNTQAPARTVVDLRAVLSKLPIGGVEASLSVFGRNIFDAKKELTFIDFGASFGGLTTANYINPRTYGVTFGVDF